MYSIRNQFVDLSKHKDDERVKEFLQPSPSPFLCWKVGTFIFVLLPLVVDKHHLIPWSLCLEIPPISPPAVCGWLSSYSYINKAELHYSTRQKPYMLPISLCSRNRDAFCCSEAASPPLPHTSTTETLKDGSLDSGPLSKVEQEGVQLPLESNSSRYRRNRCFWPPNPSPVYRSVRYTSGFKISRHRRHRTLSFPRDRLWDELEFRYM